MAKCKALTGSAVKGLKVARGQLLAKFGVFLARWSIHVMFVCYY